MGGAAVSSADTGALSSGIELNAVQRSNPEMQKRAANAVRGMIESPENFIVSIHDHGAGGHLKLLVRIGRRYRRTYRFRSTSSWRPYPIKQRINRQRISRTYGSCDC